MRNDWIDNGDTLAGLPCLTHRITKELCLFGDKGQLWEYALDQYRGLLYTRNHGEKLLRSIPGHAISYWVGRLGVPKQKGLQLKYAKEFSESSKKSG